VALKYNYPQTRQLARGAREHIRVDLQDFGSGHNAARFGCFKDDALKNGAQWRFAFARRADSPANIVHSIPASANLDSEATGTISARWARVDIAPGPYDMWTVLQIPLQADIMLRRDMVNVI